MRLTTITVGIAAVCALVAVAAPAAATRPLHASVVIRHQMAHCHTWSFDRGPSGATISGTVARGATLTFTNDDVMSHTLMLEHGPSLVPFSASPRLAKIGATVTVGFPKSGTYVFGTKAGEDYAPGVKTTGADNVLILRITVV